MTVPAAVAHGGAGPGPHRQENVEAAIARAADILEAGGTAVEAAVEACVMLEDDPVFNAGTGAGTGPTVRFCWMPRYRLLTVAWAS